MLLAMKSSEQLMELTGNLILFWKDSSLAWNSSEFGDILVVQRMASQHWTPELVLTNGVSANAILGAVHGVTRIRVTSSGNVRLVFAQQFAVSCEFRLGPFPMDHQTCNLNLQAHEVSEERMVLTETKIGKNLVIYSESNEWDLLRFEDYVITSTISYVQGFAANYSTYVCAFTFKRIATYYVLNLILPTAFLNAILVMLFFIPVESGEKISLGVTVLLSFTVFLILMDDLVPKTRYEPAYTWLLNYVMGLSLTSLVFTTIVLNVFHSTPDRKMSKSFHFFTFNILAKILGLNTHYTKHFTKRVPRNIPDEVASNNTVNTDNNNSNGTGTDFNKDSTSETELIYWKWKTSARLLDRLFGLITFVASCSVWIWFTTSI